MYRNLLLTVIILISVILVILPLIIIITSAINIKENKKDRVLIKSRYIDSNDYITDMKSINQEKGIIVDYGNQGYNTLQSDGVGYESKDIRIQNNQYVEDTTNNFTDITTVISFVNGYTYLNYPYRSNYDPIILPRTGLFALTILPNGMIWAERTDSNVNNFVIDGIDNTYLMVGTVQVISKADNKTIPLAFCYRCIAVADNDNSATITINVKVPQYQRGTTVNEFPEFYNKSIKEITNIQSHNSQAIFYRKGWTPAETCIWQASDVSNQSIPIVAQFLYGVRVFQFRLEYYEGILYLCHDCFWDGSKITWNFFCSILNYLFTISTDAIITLIINNHTNPFQVSGKIVNDFNNAIDSYSNLNGKCFKLEGGQSWPKLGPLKYNQGKNLIIFTDIETKYGNIPWSYIVGTKYDYPSANDFINEDLSIYCCVDPGKTPEMGCNCYWSREHYAIYDSTDTTIYVMSHSVTPPANFGGCAASAMVMNNYNNLLYKYNRMKSYLNKQINVVGIDFVQLPNLEAFKFYYRANNIISIYRGSDFYELEIVSGIGQILYTGKYYKQTIKTELLSIRNFATYANKLTNLFSWRPYYDNIYPIEISIVIPSMVLRGSNNMSGTSENNNITCVISNCLSNQDIYTITNFNIAYINESIIYTTKGDFQLYKDMLRYDYTLYVYSSVEPSDIYIKITNMI